MADNKEKAAPEKVAAKDAEPKAELKKPEPKAESKAESKKPEPKAKPKKKAVDVVRPEQFMNTSDWPLYRPKVLFRVKQPEEGKDEYVMVSSTGKQSTVSAAELAAEFEPVKGLHKGEDFVQQAKDAEGLSLKDEESEDDK